MKKTVSLFLALVLGLSIPVVAVGETENSQENTRLYTAKEIALALSSKNSRASNTVLTDVLLPTSMNIDIPHIDMDKVEKENLIVELDTVFAEALEKHGVEIREDMTLSEYEKIESEWVLPEYIITMAKELYPELQTVDMSQWTYGQYRDYYINQDQEELLGRFTVEQKIELAERGIQSEDLMYLFKEYQTAENILNQTDEDLKETLEGYYQFSVNKIMASVARANPPENLYTKVDMPRYGSDWFLNDVLTSEEWRTVQANRTLKAQQVLYNSTSTTLYCTNMYGTYSQSQGGAHEGIDFTCPSGAATPTIYAIFDGVKKTTSTTHQLSVYDVNSPDEPKTYTYLHMSSITAGSNITAGDAVGKQGKEGNATGYHVHFEVHLGNTTTLSSGKDHILGSVSPYRIQDYIGELSE